LRKLIENKDREIEELKNKYKTKERKLAKLNEEKEENFKKLIEEKDREITELKIKCESDKKEVYHEICTKVLNKPTVSNTVSNSTNSTYVHPKLANLPITTIHPLTIDYVKERVDNGDYTFDHYLKGPYGIVEFIQDIATCKNADGEIERNYPCTDASRERFHRLIETREWQKDTGGGFIDDIIDSVRGPVDKYHKQMLQERLENKEYDRTKGYDADEIFKKNDEMHTGVIRSDGPERRALRKKIKKETSKKMSV